MIIHTLDACLQLHTNCNQVYCIHSGHYDPPDLSHDKRVRGVDEIQHGANTRGTVPQSDDTPLTRLRGSPRATSTSSKLHTLVTAGAIVDTDLSAPNTASHARVTFWPKSVELSRTTTERCARFQLIKSLASSSRASSAVSVRTPSVGVV